MPRIEDISNAFWDDVDPLSDDAVLLYLWSWTNPKCGMAGIYRISRRKLLEGRFDEERLNAALLELAEHEKLYYVDGVLWCKARVKRLRFLSKQIVTSILNDLAEIEPDHPLRIRFTEHYKDHPKLDSRLTLNRQSKSGSTEGKVDNQPRVTRLSTTTSTSNTSEREKRKSPEKNPVDAEEIQRIFSYWLRRTDRAGRRYELTAKRRKAIGDRLREGTTPEEIKLAIDGCWGSEYHREGGYTDIELICRSRDKVESFRDKATPSANGKPDRSAYARSVKRNPELEGANP